MYLLESIRTRKHDVVWTNANDVSVFLTYIDTSSRHVLVVDSIDLPKARHARDEWSRYMPKIGSIPVF